MDAGFDELGPGEQTGELLLDAYQDYCMERHPRPGTFHPSSITLCLRRQMYEYLGTDAAPIDSPRRIQHGIEFDEFAKEHLLSRHRQAGYTVLVAERDADGREIPYLPLSEDHEAVALRFPGTPDAYVVEDRVVIDFKATAAVKQNRCKARGLDKRDTWWWQMQSYLWLGDAKVACIFMESVTGQGMAVAGYTTVARDEEAIHTIRNRLLLLNQYAADGKLPPGDCAKPPDCPYYKTCYAT